MIILFCAVSQFGIRVHANNLYVSCECVCVCVFVFL